MARALALGARGREFESHHPDQMKTASVLRFSSIHFDNGLFTFRFDLDGVTKEITLSHSLKITLTEDKVRIIGFYIGMCYLLDIAEIVLPEKIEIFQYMSQDQLQFWSDLYKDVVKEKMYALRLDLSSLEIEWQCEKDGPKLDTITVDNQKSSVALCVTGGKESLALLKLLEPHKKLVLFYLNLEKSVHRQRVHDTLKDKFQSIRTFSNRYEVINPLKIEYSDIFSGVDMAHLVFNTMLFSDEVDSVLIGNEYSSNFPNDIYQGYPINHQFVKSLDFAKRLNTFIHTFVTTDFSYFSPFFGLYEYRIADLLFSNEKYLDIWTSCNKATSTVNFCSQCDKCAFTYLVSRVRKSEQFLSKYFSENMLENVKAFKPIMDFTGEKPLDCVGDKKEVWVGLHTLMTQGVEGSVIEYFKTNIFPQISESIPKFEKEVKAMQTVPFKIPSEYVRILNDALPTLHNEP